MKQIINEQGNGCPVHRKTPTLLLIQLKGVCVVMGKCGAAQTSLIYSKQSDKSHHMALSASVFSNVEVKPGLCKDF